VGTGASERSTLCCALPVPIHSLCLKQKLRIRPERFTMARAMGIAAQGLEGYTTARGSTA